MQKSLSSNQSVTNDFPSVVQNRSVDVALRLPPSVPPLVRVQFGAHVGDLRFVHGKHLHHSVFSPSFTKYVFHSLGR